MGQRHNRAQTRSRLPFFFKKRMTTAPSGHNVTLSRSKIVDETASGGRSQRDPQIAARSPERSAIPRLQRDLQIAASSEISRSQRDLQIAARQIAARSPDRSAICRCGSQRDCQIAARSPDRSVISRSQRDLQIAASSEIFRSHVDLQNAARSPDRSAIRWFQVPNLVCLARC